MSHHFTTADVHAAMQHVRPATDIRSVTLAGFAQTCHHLDQQDRFAEVVLTSDAVLTHTRLSTVDITGLAVAVLCSRLGQHYSIEVDTDFATTMIEADPTLPELWAALQTRPRTPPSHD